MDTNFRKELFSQAYLKAVAAAAGLTSAQPLPDIDKSDWILGMPGAKGTSRSPKIDIQLKCTSSDAGGADALAYELDVDTYDVLRLSDIWVPRYLVVVTVPPEVSDWLSQTQEQLAMKKCAYYLDLKDSQEMKNSTSVTVHLPRNQVFSVEAVTSIMLKRMEEGA
ncbi:MAG TPA: DUF4365 domain-containing protein [Armatimonadota bacterium]